MRIICLHQYWASLMAYGFKRIETRSWSTPCRGWLAIHASKTKEWRNEYKDSWAERCLKSVGYETFDDLPFGAIVCVVNVTGCKSTNNLSLFDGLLGSQEKEFGDYSPNRFGWITQDCFRLTEPLPYRGQQGMWTLPEGVVTEIRKRVVKV